MPSLLLAYRSAGFNGFSTATLNILGYSLYNCQRGRTLIQVKPSKFGISKYTEHTINATVLDSFNYFLTYQKCDSLTCYSAKHLIVISCSTECEGRRKRKKRENERAGTSRPAHYKLEEETWFFLEHLTGTTRKTQAEKRNWHNWSDW